VEEVELFRDSWVLGNIKEDILEFFTVKISEEDNGKL